ncbi:LolA-related protein [uncultured Thiocystis sp.]|uniref:LolA-related protein n=1 Tax=uncultured Thiocystis sp. TaxID=1202134 RepID=UPI0025D63350|nr:LolA-related protein [uncultured Thiocystis sp.]
MPRRGRHSVLLGHAASLIFLGLSLCPTQSVATSRQPVDAQALMNLLGRVKRVEVAYQETVESTLIDIPLGTRGRLFYQAPARIRRLSDQGDGFELDGERMRLISSGRVVNEFMVSDIKPLEAMVGALRATFAGDLATLQANYQLDYQIDQTHWSLDIGSREGALSGLFERIRIIGDGATIETIEILEPNGDQRSLRMQLLAREPVEIN